MGDGPTVAERGALGTGAANPATCIRSYPGQADQIPRVRAFLTRVLDGCPAAEDVVLMADELAANAVLHSHSGEAGGVFTVRVEVREGQWVHVGVQDEGGPTAPRLRRGPSAGDDLGDDLGDDGGEGGQGLRIVGALADAWGVDGGVIGRTVWFLRSWGAA